MKLLHRIVILTILLVSFVSFAEAGSTQWEKVHNGAGLLRDLTVRESHDTGNNEKLHRNGLTLISGEFPRTGTKSIETVLTQLCFKVYARKPCNG